MGQIIGRRALIIGGGGFIGSHLTRALLDQGWAVRVMELPNRTQTRLIPKKPNLQWLEGNLSNIHDTRRALHEIEAVFHLASTTLPQSSNDNPSFDIQSNLLGTVSLLDELRSTSNVPVIFVSSGGTVYGRPRSTPIQEDHPTEPQCSYGIVKLAIEKYLALYHLLHGINYRVLRLANPYGPGQEANRAQGVIGTFMSRVLDGRPIEVWGDGSVVRDYVYIEDACEALVMAESYQGDERIFNIGSGCGHSVREIISAIERISGKRANTEFQATRTLDVPVNVLSIHRAQEELGWHPRTRLDDGLRATMNWMNESRKSS